MVNRFATGIGGLVGSVIVTLAPGNIATKSDITDYLVPDTVYAQNDLPRASICDKIERVPYTEYKKVKEKSESAVVLYYSSQKDDFISSGQTRPANYLTMMLMKDLAEKYSDKFQRFVIINFPFNEEMKQVLLEEFDKNIAPSIAIYIKGKIVARIRGPPNDADLLNGFERVHSYLKNRGLVSLSR